MPLSAKSLHASGRISDKQMSKLKVLRGTTSQRSKMAPFERKDKDEGDVGRGNRGELRPHEINHEGRQDKGGSWGTSGYGPPTKGGRAGKEGQLHVKQIDKPKMQHPKFPRGGDVSARNPKTGNTRMKGRVPAQGGQYGGGGRDTQ